MTDLTMICVTKDEAHAERFVTELADVAAYAGARLLLGADGPSRRWMDGLSAVAVESDGFVESVLDAIVDHCEPGYVLRLDDDERMTERMVEWVAVGEYRAADHWAFPRLNLWPDASSYILNPPLYPDLQTRLSVKEKAGGRTRIHAGSPFGTGAVAPVAIEHHKFLVRPLEERQRLVVRYEALQPGAGVDYEMFSVPESYQDMICVAPIGEAVAA